MSTQILIYVHFFMAGLLLSQFAQEMIDGRSGKMEFIWFALNSFAAVYWILKG